MAVFLGATRLSAQTLTTEAFLASPAAQAYRQGRYADALRALEAMEAQYPGDLTIKRIKGMALYNLEHFAKAARIFEEVVTLDRASAAGQFWYGAALYKIGAVARSYRAFQEAVALAPDSAYGRQSVNFIETIDKQTKATKRLSGELTGGVQYDDNVSLANSDPIHTTRFFEQLDSRFLLIRKPGWFVAAVAGGYFSQNASGDRDEFGNAAGDFDLMSGKAGIDIIHETSAFGIPVTPGFNYTFDLVTEGYGRFSDIHTLTTSLEANPKPYKVIKVYHKYHKDFFENDGFDPAISSRDGDRHVLGIAKYRYTKDKRHYVWLEYAHSWTDAKGSNFDARASHVSGGFSASLAQKFVLNGSVAYIDTAYPNFLGSPQRHSAKQVYSTELIRVLGTNLNAGLGYSHAFDNSNIASLETVRNIVTFSIKRQF